MLLQPRYWVNNPPKTGPMTSPKKTAVTFIPMAPPISRGGYTEVIKASPVTNIMALPTPCSTLEKIKNSTEGDRDARNVAIVNIIIPRMKILFIPYISAIRPKGTASIAEVKRKDVVIQLSKIALTTNSFAITGSATFIDEAINGVKNDAMVATSSTVLLFVSSIFYYLFL